MDEINPVAPLRSMRKLEYLLGLPRDALRRVASSVPRSYRPFRKRKRDNPAEYRIIDNPSPQLVAVQRRILRRILETVQLPPTMNGGVRGRTLRDNASAHVGQPVVLNLDIRRCFPSTTHDRVYAFFRTTFACSREIAALLTRLTTFRGCLPQGAATSTFLANVLLLPMHTELAALCRDRRLRLSQWVDDIVISGALRRGEQERFVEIVERHGYSVKRSKMRIQPNSGRQEAPGCIVNRRVSRGRRNRRGGILDYRREILEVASSGATPSAVARIRGRIASVRQLNPHEADALDRLARSKLPRF